MEFRDPFVVYTTNDPTTANLIRNLLQENGIKCLLDGADQPLGGGFIANTISVVVEAGHADEARKLIAPHDKKD
jgi:hypothetical protein